MKRTITGGIQSSNLPTKQNASPDPTYNGLYKGIVISINHPELREDNQFSLTTYDVLVTGGFMSGQILPECRVVTPMGGVSGYQERTLRAISTKMSKTDWANHDGDEVFIQFLNGDKGDPVIIGCDYSKSTSKQASIVKDDAPHSAFEYNGVTFDIDNDGVLEAIVHGGKADSKSGGFTKEKEPGATKLIAEKDKIHVRVGSNEESSLTLEKDGTVRLNGISTDINSLERLALTAGKRFDLGYLVIDELKKGTGKAVLYSDHIFLDGKSISAAVSGLSTSPNLTMTKKELTLACGSNSIAPKIKITGVPQVIQIESSGSSIKIDQAGNVKISTKSGKVTVDGSAVEISGKTKVDIKGNAAVNIKGAQVKFGSGTESFIRGDTFMTFMQKVAMHTHVTPGGPAVPSTELAAFPAERLTFLSPTIKGE